MSWLDELKVGDAVIVQRRNPLATTKTYSARVDRVTKTRVIVNNRTFHRVGSYAGHSVPYDSRGLKQP